MKLHIRQLFEELHHQLYILQGLDLSSTTSALTTHYIELLTDGAGRVEQSVVKDGATGSGGTEVALFITQCV